MRKVWSVFLLFLFVFFSCSTNNGRSSFNNDWRYYKVSEKEIDNDLVLSSAFNDSDWEMVSLPHTANIEPMVVNDQWQGDCWYRKTFEVSKKHSDKKVFIEFEAAMHVSEIWLNGEFVTKHRGGYLPVIFDVSKKIKFGQENLIVVKLDNRDNPSTGPKPLDILDFNMYGGLYRNAWITVKNQTYITNPNLVNKTASGGIFVTYSNVSEESANVNIQSHIRNDGDKSNLIIIKQELFNGDVLVGSNSEQYDLGAGADVEMKQTLVVNNPKLWSPNEPNLYRLLTTVEGGRDIIDHENTIIGIRHFEFKGNDFYLNGKKTFLRGVNRHQEYPFIGYALSDNAQIRDAVKIKNAGFDYVRLSHYPQSKAFMHACDSLGILTIDAILGWQYYSDSTEFKEYVWQSAHSLIRRDRNHACVLAWEVSINETLMPLDFIQELVKIAHDEYPGDQCFAAGWMEESYDIYIQARQARLEHYNEVQEKPYVVSEYGDWEYYAMNAGLNQDSWSDVLEEERNSRQLRGFGEKRLLQQATNIQEAHNDNFNTPAFADSYWVMFDYNRGYADDLEASGIMDIFRLPKFSYYFYQSQRDVSEKNAAMVYIANYWKPTSSKHVRIYSNCDEVELYLNDELIGSQLPDTDRISINLKHPPFTFNIDEFEVGKLKAIAKINGAVVATHEVRTPEDPETIRISIDDSGIAPQANCNDVVFAYLTVVDKNGTTVWDYSKELSIEIEGDAELLNPEPLKAEAGIATALIRIGKSKGEVLLRAKAMGLEQGDLKFIIK